MFLHFSQSAQETLNNLQLPGFRMILKMFINSGCAAAIALIST